MNPSHTRRPRRVLPDGRGAPFRRPPRRARGGPRRLRLEVLEHAGCRRNTDGDTSDGDGDARRPHPVRHGRRQSDQVWRQARGGRHRRRAERLVRRRGPVGHGVLHARRQLSAGRPERHAPAAGQRHAPGGAQRYARSRRQRHARPSGRRQRRSVPQGGQGGFPGGRWRSRRHRRHGDGGQDERGRHRLRDHLPGQAPGSAKAGSTGFARIESRSSPATSSWSPPRPSRAAGARPPWRSARTARRRRARSRSGSSPAA